MSRTPSGSGSGCAAAAASYSRPWDASSWTSSSTKNGLPALAWCTAVTSGEGISASPSAQPLRAGARQPADVLTPEALQPQPRRARGERTERRRELVARVRLALAVGGDRQHRLVGQRARDELQREHRRDVGPVQVVEHDDERSALRDRDEQAGERVEEAKARLVGVQRRRLRGRAERGRQLRQQTGDPGGAVAEAGAQRGGVLAARERAGDLHPRPVRGRSAAVPARAPCPRGAALVRRARRTRAPGRSCRCPARPSRRRARRGRRSRRSARRRAARARARVPRARARQSPRPP